MTPEIALNVIRNVSAQYLADADLDKVSAALKPRKVKSCPATDTRPSARDVIQRLHDLAQAALKEKQT